MFSCHLLIGFLVQRQSKYIFQDCLKYQNAMTADDNHKGAWRNGLHARLVTWMSWVRVPPKPSFVSLSKTLYPYCLVLVDSRNGFERDFTIELKLIEGLVED